MFCLILYISAISFDITDKNRDRAIDKFIDRLVNEHFVAEKVANYTVPVFLETVSPFRLIMNKYKERIFRITETKKGFRIEFLSEEYNKIVRMGRIPLDFGGLIKIKSDIKLDTIQLLLYVEIDTSVNSDSILVLKNIGTFAFENFEVLLNGDRKKVPALLKPDSMITIIISPFLSYELSVKGGNYAREFQINQRIGLEFYPSINTEYDEVMEGDIVHTSLNVVNRSEIDSPVSVTKSVYYNQREPLTEELQLELKPESDTTIYFRSHKIPAHTTQLRIEFKASYDRFVRNFRYKFDVLRADSLFNDELPLPTGIKRNGTGFCYGYDDETDSTYYKRDAFIMKEYFEKVFGIKSVKIFDNHNEFLGEILKCKDKLIFISVMGPLRKEGNQISIGRLSLNALKQNLKQLNADTVLLFMDLLTDKKLPMNFDEIKKFKNSGLILAEYSRSDWRFEKRNGMLISFLIKYLNLDETKNFARLKTCLEKDSVKKISVKLNRMDKFVIRR